VLQSLLPLASSAYLLGKSLASALRLCWAFIALTEQWSSSAGVRLALLCPCRAQTRHTRMAPKPSADPDELGLWSLHKALPHAWPISSKPLLVARGQL